MKEIIKASVAGYSFTFETEAYSYLDTYLKDIEVHFRTKEDGREIVADIEERISELLRLDLGNSERVVSLNDIEKLIRIMGNPSDMIDESAEPVADKENVEPENRNPLRKLHNKRLFRDESSAILGGVLAGLANYFDVDKVWLRLAFALIIVLGHKVFSGLSSVLIIAYIVMWIIVPKAKTIHDKLRMSGKEPSIQDIESGRSEPLIRQKSKVERVIPKVFKILLVVILFSLAASLVGVFVFLMFFPAAFDFPSLSDVLEVTGIYSPDILWTLVLVCLLPVFLVIYFSVRIIGGFKQRDFVILGSAFVIWIAICAYLGVKGVKIAADYRYKSIDTQLVVVNSPSDSIYLDLGMNYKNAVSSFYFFDDDRNSDCPLRAYSENRKAWFFIPSVNLVEDDTKKQVEIWIQKKVFARTPYQADLKAKSSRFSVEQNDSLITLNPHVYSRDNHWDREVFDVTVYYPKGKKVVLANGLVNEAF